MFRRPQELTTDVQVHASMSLSSSHSKVGLQGSQHYGLLIFSTR